MNETMPLGSKKRFPAVAAALVLVLGVVAIALLILLRQAGARSGGPAGDRVSTGAIGAGTRTNEANAVTVSIDWRGTSAGPVFKVALNTHSVNLDSYDLSRIATLQVDQGLEIRPSGWDAPRGGHHREGTLKFPATAADGSPLIGPSTRALELVIRDLAGVPQRTFRWP